MTAGRHTGVMRFKYMFVTLCETSFVHECRQRRQRRLRYRSAADDSKMKDNAPCMAMLHHGYLNFGQSKLWEQQAAS